MDGRLSIAICATAQCGWSSITARLVMLGITLSLPQEMAMASQHISICVSTTINNTISIYLPFATSSSTAFQNLNTDGGMYTVQCVLGHKLKLMQVFR